ncbi:DUF4157 domain-containing protein [Floridanema aerugineum]|uniref:DUF4157 domain-containing protein n=1 Tax=Floridaenema aerugineum BLCC-F46 TaxID=3153654 RepID=A0ABV4X3M2_9CYAN
MSMRSQIQKKPVSSSYSPPAQKATSWQRPFSDPVHDAKPDETVQSKIAPDAGFNLLQMKLFPDAPTPVQAKLSVGAPGDKYEQQADSVATKVMTMPAPENEEPIQREALPEEKKEEKVQTKPLAATVTPLVQRETAAEEPQEEEVQAKALSGNTIQRETAAEEPQEEEVQAKAESEGKSSNNSNLESQLNGSKGGGSPLPDEVRAFMEPRFGADFSGVRVHTDGAAVQMNKELGAQAFAHGSDIYYGAGKSPGNDELTAHEMTHVLQQTGGAQLQAKLPQQDVQPVNIGMGDQAWVQRYPDTSFEIVRMGLANAVLEQGMSQVIEKKKTKDDLLNEAFWMAYPEMNGKAINGVSDPKQKQTYIDAYLHIKNNLYPKVKKQEKRKVKHTTGKQVDTYLKASPFIKKYVEDKFKAGTQAEGHVHIHTPEDFVKECVKYLMARNNPDTGTFYTKKEAKKEEPKINAFRDGTEIHIHQERGEAGTAIHESIHLFSNDSYKSKVGFNANEGTTEYFTRLICTEQKIKRGKFYTDQHKSIEKLVGASSKDKLAGAYFQGKVAELQTALDAKGKDTFSNWISFMKKGKYADANALL